MQRKMFSLIALVMLLAVVLSACTPTATPTTAPVEAAEAPTTEAPTAAPAVEEPTAAPTEAAAESDEVDLASLSGDIYTAGSSTVYPLSEKIAEMFQNDGFPGTVKIDSIGSGAGFERFCKTGETDISNASRGIKDAEVENCGAIDRTPIELRVGTDAIAIVVSKENDFLTDVTLAELAKIFSSEAVNWSDVNAEWPAEPIQRFVPGTDSGTFDYFIEVVNTPIYGTTDKEAGKALFLEAQNLSQSEDDNVLVQGVEGSKYAIGFFGYAYFNENSDKLNAISVEGVAPSFETAEDGSYKLSRPLFLYTDAGILAEKPQVAAFLSYYLANVNDVIGEVGYFPASDENIDASIQALEAALSGKAPAAAGLELPEVDLASLSGDIYTAGSSTVYPLSEKIAEMFQNDGFPGTVKIDSIGSGAGFERFCKTGETDISNASRGIKDAEVENCGAIDRTPIELRVGTDAIAIVVSKENDFLADVTLAELAKIFSSEAVNWSDVNAEWPAEPIQRFVPGTDSGTFDYFIEVVNTPIYGTTDKEAGKALFLEAQNLSQSEDDNVLVHGVEGSKYAIGFFGYAYFNENSDKLNAISVEGVAPSFETAEDGSYKLSRPLFLYTDASILAEKPQVAAFLSYYLANVNDVIGEVGYFPASDENIEASMQALLDALQ